MTITTEVVRNIYNDDNGAFVSVSPAPDEGCGVQLRTIDKRSQEWYGTFNFSLPSNLAREVAKAILKAADEADERDAK